MQLQQNNSSIMPRRFIPPARLLLAWCLSSSIATFVAASAPPAHDPATSASGDVVSVSVLEPAPYSLVARDARGPDGGVRLRVAYHGLVDLDGDDDARRAERLRLRIEARATARWRAPHHWDRLLFTEQTVSGGRRADQVRAARSSVAQAGQCVQRGSRNLAARSSGGAPSSGLSLPRTVPLSEPKGARSWARISRTIGVLELLQWTATTTTLTETGDFDRMRMGPVEPASVVRVRAYDHPLSVTAPRTRTWPRVELSGAGAVEVHSRWRRVAIFSPLNHSDVTVRAVGGCCPSSARRSRRRASTSTSRPASRRVPRPHYSTVHCCYSTVTVQNSTITYRTVPYRTAPYSTVQYSTVRYGTVQYSTVRYGTAQHSTVQYGTVHYITHPGESIRHPGDVKMSRVLRVLAACCVSRMALISLSRAPRRARVTLSSTPRLRARSYARNCCSPMPTTPPPQTPTRLTGDDRRRVSHRRARRARRWKGSRVLRALCVRVSVLGSRPSHAKRDDVIVMSSWMWHERIVLYAQELAPSFRLACALSKPQAPSPIPDRSNRSKEAAREAGANLDGSECHLDAILISS